MMQPLMSVVNRTQHNVTTFMSLIKEGLEWTKDHIWSFWGAADDTALMKNKVGEVYVPKMYKQ